MKKLNRNLSIFLLLISSVCFAQKKVKPKDNARTNIVMLKNGALFVRLKTSELQISGFKKRGKEKGNKTPVTSYYSYPYARRLDPSVLAFSLSLYRHPFIYILLTQKYGQESFLDSTQRLSEGPRPRRLTKTLQPSSQCPMGPVLQVIQNSSY